MTLPRTAAEVLSGHVTLEVRCIDRVLVTVRQPRLQYGQGIHRFFCQHRGNQFVSSALMLPMTARFGAGIRHYIDTRRPGPGPVREGAEWLCGVCGRLAGSKRGGLDRRARCGYPGCAAPIRLSCPAHSRSRSTNFCTLPVEVLGSGPNSTVSGHL